MLLYDDITSASALAEAKRVWESLRPEAVSSHAKQLWPDGANETAQRMIAKCNFDAATGCVIWRDGSKNLYPTVRVAGRVERGHRVAWLLFVGHLPRALCVLHKCDNCRCVNPFHLFVGTRDDNNKDACAKGRTRAARGELKNTAKVTRRDVVAIRQLYQTHAAPALAKRFGVTPNQIRLIANRKSWAWLP